VFCPIKKCDKYCFTVINWSAEQAGKNQIKVSLENEIPVRRYGADIAFTGGG
jgi:hypothetical protein